MIRVSTPEQAKDYKAGLDRQRRDIRFSRNKHNLELLQEFKLGGVTGIAVRQSKEWKAIRALLARPDVDGLVIPTIDRLSRTSQFSEVAALVEPFEELFAGKSTKRLWTGSEELDMTNPKDRDILWRKIQQAEEEREITAYRTSEGKDDMRIRPDAKVDPLPNGILWHRIDPHINAGTFRYDPEVKAKMKEAFHRVLTGESLRSLFNEYGFHSQSALRNALRSKWWIGYKCKTKTYSERKWDIERGRFLKRKQVELPESKRFEIEIPELRSDPCVTDEVFYAVQAMFGRHARTWTQNKSLLNDFLGIGLLHCSCGRKMYHKIHMTSGIRYYFCSYRVSKKGEPCNERMSRADEIDGKISLEAVLQLTRKEFVKSQIKESMDVARIEFLKGKLSRLEKEIAELNRKRRRMLDVIADGDATREEYAPRLKEVRESLAEAEIKAREAREALSLVLTDNDADAIAETLQQSFANFASMTPQKQKETLAKYVERIEMRRNECTDDISLNLKVKISLAEVVYAQSPNPIVADPAAVASAAANGVRLFPAEARSKLNMPPKWLVTPMSIR